MPLPNVEQLTLAFSEMRNLAFQVEVQVESAKISVKPEAVKNAHDVIAEDFRIQLREAIERFYKVCLDK